MDAPQGRVRRLQEKFPSSAGHREAQNQYYLNGTKCRAPGYHDIFLGTGLGPRSSRLSSGHEFSKLMRGKPDEVAVVYRRSCGHFPNTRNARETENRIRPHHENLRRLTDLREELERQLAHLQRQPRRPRVQEFKAKERSAHRPSAGVFAAGCGWNAQTV